MKQKFSISIWITKRCNFRCTYCYEKSKYSMEDLSFETADQIVDFVKANIKDGQELSVQFHGGEPTLNFEVLRHLVERFENDRKKCFFWRYCFNKRIHAERAD